MMSGQEFRRLRLEAEHGLRHSRTCHGAGTNQCHTRTYNSRSFRWPACGRDRLTQTSTMPFGGACGSGFVFCGKAQLVVGRTGDNHGEHVLAFLSPNVGQHRAARGHHLGHQAVHPVRMLGAQSIDHEGLGELHQVGECVGVALCVPAAAKDFPTLRDCAEVPLVDDGNLDREPVPLDSRGYLRIHHEGRLADDAGHAADSGPRHQSRSGPGRRSPRRRGCLWSSPALRRLKKDKRGGLHPVLADFGMT